MSDAEKQNTEQTRTEDTASKQDAQTEGGSNPNHWEAIQQDFQSLGRNISNAVKDMWHDERTRGQVNELRNCLENMSNQVGQAIDETINTAKSKNIKDDVQKAVGEIKNMGDKVYTDTKPHLVSALKMLDETIQKVIGRLEHVAEQPPSPSPKAEETETKNQTS